MRSRLPRKATACSPKGASSRSCQASANTTPSMLVSRRSGAAAVRASPFDLAARIPRSPFRVQQSRMRRVRPRPAPRSRELARSRCPSLAWREAYRSPNVLSRRSSTADTRSSMLAARQYSASSAAASACVVNFSTFSIEQVHHDALLAHRLNRDELLRTKRWSKSSAMRRQTRSPGRDSGDRKARRASRKHAVASRRRRSCYPTRVEIHHVVPPGSFTPPRLSSSSFLTGSWTEVAPAASARR